jgi:dTDP-4-dehydrorhamnose reductase
LVLGVNGQLGHAIRQAVDAGLGQGLTDQWVWADRHRCDLSRPDQVRDVVADLNPGLIINAAAYTAVDKAESEPASAQAVNADSVAELARHAGRHHIPLLHFSTDYVFNGRLDRPYSESDATDPQSTYGRTKLAGEQAVQAHAHPHLLMRTSWVFGPHGGNFIKTMLRLAQERDALRVVGDQWGAPTSAPLLAQQALRACQQALRDQQQGRDARWGLYHLCARGEISWHGYAVHVLTQAQRWGLRLRVTPDQVECITTDQYPTPAQRPLNSRLDTRAWEQAWKVSLPTWQAGVDDVLAQILADQGVLAPAMRDKITSDRSAQ